MVKIKRGRTHSRCPVTSDPCWFLLRWAHTSPTRVFYYPTRESERQTTLTLVHRQVRNPPGECLRSFLVRELSNLRRLRASSQTPKAKCLSCAPVLPFHSNGRSFVLSTHLHLLTSLLRIHFHSKSLLSPPNRIKGQGS